ncbi:MAG TPA: DUF4238 domain-containing protein [Clostridium sp.]|uniref:DUF4238 domain-containing protein n=1 Tax=Clostridium sp. TaxID=1506 RepID=UPI002F959F56
MHNPKYHHLIPKTYLKAWCYSNESTYVMDKKTKLIETKNIGNNFGISQFHSIVAGMPICEEDDLVQIFKALSGYEIFYESKQLNNLDEYNRNYLNFANWIIKKDEIQIVDKKKRTLKTEIGKVKIKDIENLWATKYEDKWKCLLETIEHNIYKTNSLKVDEFLKGIIMKFVIAFNWRGFYSNELFMATYKTIISNANLDKINIPVGERYKNNLDTVEKEFEHLMVLKKYREFLKDEGLMYDSAKNYIRLMSIKFCISTGNNKFITSDNPSFICVNNEGHQLEHIMPISPNVVMAIGLDGANDNKYIIERISDKQVSQINKKILDNSIERIISIQNKIKF